MFVGGPGLDQKLLLPSTQKRNKQATASGCLGFKCNDKGRAHCTLDPLNPAHCVSLIMTPNTRESSGCSKFP